MRYLFLLLLLAGCEGGRPGSVSRVIYDWQNPPAQVNHERCLDFGYEDKSDGYANCRLQLARNDAVAKGAQNVDCAIVESHNPMELARVRCN